MKQNWNFQRGGKPKKLSGVGGGGGGGVGLDIFWNTLHGQLTEFTV